jgi:hypothetical protein
VNNTGIVSFIFMENGDIIHMDVVILTWANFVGSLCIFPFTRSMGKKWI